MLAVWVHKQGVVEGFTKKYNVHRLVYCEPFAPPREAILREKRLKKRNRAWKLALIESVIRIGRTCRRRLWGCHDLDSRWRGNDAERGRD